MSDVRIEPRDDGITVVTLDRPERLNAMTLELVHELDDVFARLSADDSCRAIVLTGAGRGFCSGHDLGELQDSEAEGELAGVPAGMHVQEAFASLATRMRDTAHPIVAAVNGPAAGGGLALALAADTRVAAASARFNAAFVRIGLSGCDMGVSYLLPRVVGPTLAFEMMLTGRLVDAPEAEKHGLVLRVVPDGEVVAAAVELAEQTAANTPFGIRMTKQVMWANLDAPSLETALALENRTQILCTQTADQREAITAFVERRPPRFEGR